MASREALLQAVIDSPDDDAPRLAYADALQADGDSDRAEFIHVQCALDRMPPQEPQRHALEAREKELLDQHGWDWAEEFEPWVSEWVYRRGFIERVQMCLETTADEILTVLRKAPIRHVRDTTQFCELEGVIEVLPHLEHLTGLEFWGLYAFDDQLVGQMLSSPHLRNLRTLILHHDRNGNMVEEKMLVEAMASPYRANLEELGVNIDGCWRGPSEAILSAMARSPYLRNLRKLTISHASNVEGRVPPMSAETVRSMGGSPNFAYLEELDLGKTGLSLEAWDEVLKWPWLSELKWLRLHYARQVQAPDFFYTVAELENLPAYRSAFEERAETVDWHTETVSPWDGHTCWRGLTWESRPRNLLYEMNRFIRAQDYAGLEAEYRRLLSGHPVATEIDELPFERYQASLYAGLRQAVASIESNRGNCIFLRLKMDIDWEGTFHVQAHVPPSTEPYEEGTYEAPEAEFPGSRFTEAAHLYARRPLYVGTQIGGAALYLLAKTVAAFGRCLNDYPRLPPVYFSCQHAVFRMRGESSSGPEGAR